MSLDANLIDLDSKVIYDISGGRHLYWMLPKLKGHRIIITHDNNEGMDIDLLEKFKGFGFREVLCDRLADELEIDFSNIPDDFYSICTSLVDLGYGIYFNKQLGWLPDDLKLEVGVDGVYNEFWYKIGNVKELVNCCNDLYSVSLAEAYTSNFGNCLSNKDFVDKLKLWSESVEVRD